jgi:peptidyl-prolyl cis-trans isomerase C
MKMNHQIIVALIGATVLTASRAVPADTAPPQSKSSAVAKLFEDEILCKGKGVEIRRSEVDEAFLLFKANMTANGQAFPEARREEVETQLLDRLVATKLLVDRAVEEDKAPAKMFAEKFAADAKRRAGSDDAFERQLRAMGFTPDKFGDQVLERAICEQVVERELKSKVTITDEEAKKFYENNSQEFERPEMVRASHILLSTVDPLTRQDLSEDRKKEKKQQLERLLERARKGEDFAALAKEFSDDTASKDAGGEYTFPRGKMVPEFEKTAFSMKTNEVSDIITTQFGYHIIKLHERVPAQKLEYAKTEKDLKEYLARQQVEKQLPAFLEKLKKEANLEYLNGAKPPSVSSGAAPAGKPAPKSIPP